MHLMLLASSACGSRPRGLGCRKDGCDNPSAQPLVTMDDVPAGPCGAESQEPKRSAVTSDQRRRAVRSLMRFCRFCPIRTRFSMTNLMQKVGLASNHGPAKPNSRAHEKYNMYSVRWLNELQEKQSGFKRRIQHVSGAPDSCGREL